MSEVEIARWSGIWEKDLTVRVGVRLADGRDALLIASAGPGSGDQKEMTYQLIINGEDHHRDFIMPADLEKALKRRLQSLSGAKRPVSLRDLNLF